MVTVVTYFDILTSSIKGQNHASVVKRIFFLQLSTTYGWCSCLMPLITLVGFG